MNSFRYKIEHHQFVAAVEIDPPKGPDSTEAERNIELAESKADVLNVADCPMSNLRMNSICFASMALQKYNAESIVHMTCRDHSIMGLESLLLGAHGLGIRNILTLTGDRSPIEAKNQSSKFELNSIDLLRMCQNLNKGLSYEGKELNGRTNFFAGTTATPNAEDLDAEIAKLSKKKDAGARFAETQPIYDIETAKQFLEKTKSLDLPILFGIMPLAGPKMAKYMNEKVPGVTIPDHVIEEIEQGGHDAGVVQARHLIGELRDIGAAGVILMLSEKHMDDISDIL